METIQRELARHFDRRVVIAMNRTGEFYNRLPPVIGERSIEIIPFAAIDAKKCKPPPNWTDLPAMWGCTESHKQVISRALCDGIERLLIMEDDCAFVPGSAENLAAFMLEMNSDYHDWQGIMLGGQVSVNDGKTDRVSERVSRCLGHVERLHCYALNREGMQIFHDVLCEYTSEPNDFRWGRIQEEGKIRVYRMEPFIAYQVDGRSSISGRVEPSRIWDGRVDVRIRRPEDIPIVSLVCPFEVMERLRDAGIISNGGESPPFMAQIAPGTTERAEINVSRTLLNAFKERPEIAAQAVLALRGDAAFHRRGPLVLWHPTTHTPYPGAKRVEAQSYEEAEHLLSE